LNFGQVEAERIRNEFRERMQKGARRFTERKQREVEEQLAAKEEEVGHRLLSQNLFAAAHSVFDQTCSCSKRLSVSKLLGLPQFSSFV